jgi:hypothetical protein
MGRINTDDIKILARLYCDLAQSAEKWGELAGERMTSNTLSEAAEVQAYMAAHYGRRALALKDWIEGETEVAVWLWAIGR